MAERAMAPPPVFASSLYHWQQAAEKSLKAFLTWHDSPFRRTHRLQVLIRQCQTIDASFADLMEAATVLTPYAEDTRYPGNPQVYSREDTEEARRLAEQVVAFVVGRLPPGFAG